jgi:hypothetical protein
MTVQVHTFQTGGSYLKLFSDIYKSLWAIRKCSVTVQYCVSPSHVSYILSRSNVLKKRDKMSLLEQVIRRDESLCRSDWYLLLADTEAKSWRSLDTSMGSKTSTYLSQVFKIQSQQSLNHLTKNKIEVTGTQVLLSVETMDCRESSMKRRHIASTFSYTLGRYPSSESNSSTMNSLKREAPCIILQYRSYFVLSSMYRCLVSTLW